MTGVSLPGFRREANKFRLATKHCRASNPKIFHGPGFRAVWNPFESKSQSSKQPPLRLKTEH
jgi:hypothetical protein